MQRRGASSMALMAAILAAALAIASGADFTIAGTPASQSVVQGSGTTYTVNVTAVNGFTGNTVLSVTGLPTGATGTFNPTTITGGTGSSTLTITTLATTPVSTSTLKKSAAAIAPQ